MADPLSLLAPPVAPTAPAVVTSSAAGGVDALGGVGASGLLLAATLAVALVGAAALAWWWRDRWPRALRRVQREASPVAAAGQLARHARRHAVPAPDVWWAALDALRFGRPGPGQAAALQDLLAQARAFVPRDRPWDPASDRLWRRARRRSGGREAARRQVS